jgi:DNA-binding LacI/PurR family transcriptional regulator
VLGYRRALVEANIRTREDYIVEGDFRFAGGSVAAARLLALDESPSAVFVCNDMMAIGALQAFRTARVRVPEDISVVGYDDIPLACAVTPALTTIAQPIVEMATLSIEMLMTRMLGSGERTNARRRVLEPRIVVRESCREFGEGREQNHD